MGRPPAAVLAATAVLLLAACGAGATASEPTWRPKPSFTGENANPGPRQPVQPHQGGPPARSGRPGAPSGSGTKTDPAVVATNLTTPTGIAIMPDNTALVGERTTGRILRVRPLAGRPVTTVRTITGLSTVGGGGLLDLALSPNYVEDNLIFAYLTSPADNRVVDFTLTGPVTPVVTGIPRGRSDNTGRIAFAANGDLLIGTGDGGRAADAASPNSLAGKVLRVTDIGTPAAGNPSPGSRVYTSGHRVVDGLCTSTDSTSVFEVETRPRDAADPINLLEPGASYGWPQPGSAYRGPANAVPDSARSPGGCAVLSRRLYVTSRDGSELLSARIGPSTRGRPTIGAYAVALRKRYGRLLTVVAAGDGALWLTTTNRDGAGRPVADDERVLRIVPSGGSAHDRT
ncbi:MAG: PQQ-dependent sugar dehydrogenase [Actinomycetota bacterium]|nr:PQQ-dependent sugar dehydrogenase [Actinomycetota bacterium]